MAEKNKSPIMVGLAVLLVVVVAGYLFTKTDLYDELTGRDEIVSEETKEELAFVLKWAVFLENRLSNDAKDSLAEVADYIKENPEVLDDEKGLILPSPIEVALAKVKLELLKEAVDWGQAEDSNTETSEGTDSSDDTNTEDTEEETDTNESATAGEQVIITGVLEDYAGENPFGATYMITDQTTGTTYYFAFGENTVNTINSQEMVGQVVDVTVEMTGEGQEFTVVSGPTLAIEEVTTVDEVEDTTGDEVEDTVDDTASEENEGM